MTYFGLTGGIASGKTTVAHMFAELGASVIDADRIGHEILRWPDVLAEIVQSFGTGVLDAAGEINRGRLGPVVFADPGKRRVLDQIVHPRIIARIEQLAAEYSAARPHAVVIVDAALIYEAGIGGYPIKVVVAWCRPEQQLERLIAKGKLGPEEAERRIRAQMPVEEKFRRADYVIDCSGSKEHTRAQVSALYPELVCIVAQRAETGPPRPGPGARS
jgi:dephospho-CoA kinase